MSSRYRLLARDEQALLSSRNEGRRTSIIALARTQLCVQVRVGRGEVGLRLGVEADHMQQVVVAVPTKQ